MLQIELHKYLDLSPDFSATAPYVFVGTGLLILFLATLACCCTVKEQPILLYIVSIPNPNATCMASYAKCK